MQEKHSKKTALNPKKRVGDIPPSSNLDTEKTPGEAPQGKSEITPDVPKIRRTHPEPDGCGDESAGRKSA